MESPINPSPVNNNIPERRHISTGIGILIIVSLASLFFGGVFAYQYFAMPQIPLTNTESISVVKKSDNFPINWIVGKDYSEHVGSKTAGFPIEKSSIKYTKELEWPVIKNIPDEQVLLKINKILDFDKTIEFTEFDATENNGITSVGFDVNYDKNNILSLTVHVSTYGAYPDEFSTNYLINLKNAELVTLSDIFYQNKINDLVGILNKKLQENVNEAINQNPQLKQDINCNRGMEGCMYPDGFTFTEENLKNFVITSDGIKFAYDFGFPHVSQALEPNGVMILTYSQLKDYISKEGLLGSEIKN